MFNVQILQGMGFSRCGLHLSQVTSYSKLVCVRNKLMGAEGCTASILSPIFPPELRYVTKSSMSAMECDYFNRSDYLTAEIC